jgi:hypothetical protein
MPATDDLDQVGVEVGAGVDPSGFVFVGVERPPTLDFRHEVGGFAAGTISGNDLGDRIPTCLRLPSPFLRLRIQASPTLQRGAPVERATPHSTSTTVSSG